MRQEDFEFKISLDYLWRPCVEEGRKEGNREREREREREKESTLCFS
jgi:hypothetical protein